MVRKSDSEEEEFCAACFISGPPSQRASTLGSLLIQGPPKVGKSMFSKNYAKCFRQVRGRSVVYVTTDEPPDQLLAELRNTLGQEEGIRILDCYTWRTGLKGHGGFLASSSANLSDLSITLQNVTADLEQPYLIFDSISSLALDSSEDAALRFLRMYVPRIKMNRSFGLFTVSEGLHSSSFLNVLRTIFDGIIEMKIEESPKGVERLVRVFAGREPSPIANWTKFSVTEKGIKIGTSLYRAKVTTRHSWEYFRGRTVHSSHKTRVEKAAQRAGNMNMKLRMMS